MFLGTYTYLVGEQNAVVLNKVVIEHVLTIRYLGIIIYNRISFKHVNCIIEKNAERVDLWSTVSSALDASTKINVYGFLIVPYYEQCPTLLFMMNKPTINQL